MPSEQIPTGKPNPKPEIKYTKLFINNEWVETKSGKKLEVHNPATGDKITDVCWADKSDVDRAVNAAREAFRLDSKWRLMDASERGRLLYKVCDLICRDADYLASLESLDNGKPFRMSHDLELPSVCRIFRYYAGLADKVNGKVIPVDGEFFCYTRQEPVGVVAAIVSWDLPLLLAARKIAAALAAGCTMVIKSSEKTPLATLYLANLFKEAGFPPGVVNVISGDGPITGEALANHEDVDKISFTGTTENGQHIVQSAGKSNLKRVMLELGGKSPIIVLDDADLELTLDEVSKGLNLAGGRVLVHEKLYEKFVDGLTLKAKERHIGDPFEPTTDMGAIISQDKLKQILDLVESGKKEGATLVCGGKQHGSKGFYLEPTILKDVKDDMRIAREEIFGPVLLIMKPFKDLKEVLCRANNSRYGLAASVFTRDLNRANCFSAALKHGCVWINSFKCLAPQTPFGGYKMSGWGRENGESGLEEYTEIKTVISKVEHKAIMA